MIIPYLFLLFYLNISSSISTKFTSDLNLFFDKCKNLKNDKICDVKSILHKNAQSLLREIHLFNTSLDCPCLPEQCQSHSGFQVYIVISDFSNFHKDSKDTGGNEELSDIITKKLLPSPCNNTILLITNLQDSSVYAGLGEGVKATFNSSQMSYFQRDDGGNGSSLHNHLLSTMQHYRSSLVLSQRLRLRKPRETLHSQMAALVFNSSTWTLLLNHFLFFVIISLHVLLVLLY